MKLLLKEDIIPANADKLMFWMAPLVSVTMALLAYAALPIGPAIFRLRISTSGYFLS